MKHLLVVLFLASAHCQNFLTKPAIYQATQPIEHGEGPIWDSRKGVLYFVNTFGWGLLCYDFKSGAVNSIDLEGAVTMMSITEDDPELLLVAVNNTLVSLRWDGRSGNFSDLKVLTTIEEKYAGSRFNDGKADVDGNLWISTMGPQDDSGDVMPDEGSLYRITECNIDDPSAVVSPVSIGNGLAWSADNSKFYYIDSPTHHVVEYNFDAATGNISDPRVVFDLDSYPQFTGIPDGMTIDTEDNLWVALYKGGTVIKVNPETGELLKTIGMPAKGVSSVMFGGPDLGVLFVTTSWHDLSEEEKKSQPAAGSLFAVENTGSYGREVYRARIV